MSPATPWRPLEGVTVVDLTRMVPGGMATLLLADLGATIIKVERPGGDEMRALAPMVGENSSAQHAYVDRGKRSVTVDLKLPEGRRTVEELVAGADAVIESFRPGVAARLGVGYEQLSALQPSLVYVSLTGYGQTGPRARTAGHDINFVGYAGLLGPELPTSLVADVPGGMLAALALVSGIMTARATGRGAHVDLALADAALVMASVRVAEELASRDLDQAVESPINGDSPNYGVYETSDGRLLAVGALEDKFWNQTCALLERPQWLGRQHDPSLAAELSALFAQHDLRHWTALLATEDTCITPVLHLGELPDDEHFAARGSVRQVETDAGPLWQVASPFVETDS